MFISGATGDAGHWTEVADALAGEYTVLSCASQWLADGLRAPMVDTPGAHVPQATHPRALAETLRPILGKLAAGQRFEA